MTNKVDKLLQKVNTFEKLALFGSRKNFLSAIAQEVRIVFPPENLVEALRPVEAKLQSVVRQVGSQLPQSNEYLNNLQLAANTLGKLMQTAYVTTFADLKGKAEALGSQLMNVRSGTYGLARAPELSADMKSYLTQLSGEASGAYNVMTSNPTIAQALGVQDETNAPMAQQTAPSAGGRGATIPKDVQQKLSEMLSVRGDFIPFAADGVLGSQTQQALNIFQQKYNQGSKLPAGEELYDAIRKSYNLWKIDQKYQAGEYSKPMTPTV